MDKNRHSKGGEGGAKHVVRQKRDWKRIHHSPLFWIGVLLFIAAGAIYVLSDNLAFRP
jgi:hypothetical protein